MEVTDLRISPAEKTESGERPGVFAGVLMFIQR